MSSQVSTRFRGLQSSRFSAPSPAGRNAIAALLPIFSPATGASKAPPSKFAISFRRAKSLRSPGASQQASPHDQAAHYRNYAHGRGFLRHRPSARKRNDSLDPACAFLYERMGVLSSSPRGCSRLFFDSIPRRETACRRSRLHAPLPEIFRVSRGRNRSLSSPRGTRSLFARALWLQDLRKQKRQRPLRHAIRSPALYLRLRNAESSSRTLRERAARQPCAPLRRSPP